VPAGLLIAVGVFVGAFFGAKLAGAVSATTMRRCYGVFLLLVAVYLLFGPQLKPGSAPPVERLAPAEGRPAT
jgi:uncharacterized protein